MEIKKTLILDCSEPVSKATAYLMEMPSVIVTKNGKYYGLLDHRSIASHGIRGPNTVKCETVVVKPPVLITTSGILERVNAFLLGHFKGLPVVDEENNPLGITTRVELLNDMRKEKLLPTENVAELMSTPAYTITEDETLATAKRVMKEKNARRLIVIRNTYPIGLVSAFEIASWATKPKESGRKSKGGVANEKTAEDMRISDFLRPDITTIEQGANLEEAVDKMVKNQVSAVIVTTNKKPAGVLSALDIFKKLQENSQTSIEITISGLNEENRGEYTHIKEKIGHVLDKFSRSFNIRNVSVHVKEQKSTCVVSVYLETDEGHTSLKEERKSLKETVDELAAELNRILGKKKELRQLKPRVMHAGREEE